MADWLVKAQGADPKRVGIAGHSMGGKDAVLAAAQYGGFASVVLSIPTTTAMSRWCTACWPA
jgi:dipeptidyl aminopeptidase/acylaminoacyl peptidase